MKTQPAISTMHRAQELGVLAKARPALAKRGLEVDFEVVAIFY